MNMRSAVLFPITVLALAMVGCYEGNKPVAGQAAKPVPNAEEEAEIKADLAKLSPEDRKLAEAQGFCAIQDFNRLGSMGVPYKIMIQDQPVFLCCKGCSDEAMKDPAKTLAKVKELKDKVAAGK